MEAFLSRDCRQTFTNRNSLRELRTGARAVDRRAGPALRIPGKKTFGAGITGFLDLSRFGDAARGLGTAWYCLICV